MNQRIINIARNLKERIKIFSNNQQYLYYYFVVVLMITNTILLFTNKYNIVQNIAFIFIPLGIQMILMALPKRPGLMFLLLLPKSFLDAFQLVLIALWGGSIIAVDMFLNLATTNPGEAGELLSDLIPILLLIIIIYVPSIILSFKSLNNKRPIDKTFKKRKLRIGTIITIIGFAAISIAIKGEKAFTIKYDLYPCNVIYNLDFAINKSKLMKDYQFFSNGFKYNSHRIINNEINNSNNNPKKREIYVLILGETGRAANWSLYGYNRKTTPHIDTMSNLIKFSDVFTQSNTTHKIVSMLLTPADAERYNYIYYTKSIISAFSEAGFKTIYLTNHEYNQTFMQYYFNEADISLSVRHKGKNIDDQTMIPYIKNIIKKESKENLFIFVHLYGSHFKYQQRYGKEFAHFKPDMVENISVKSKEKLINSYDNSILNTDDFIYKTVKAINDDNSTSAVLYLSDHGEDLMDDKRNRFLHASPVPTYYQLHIPYIIWFSDKYIKYNPQKYQNAIIHKDCPLSNNSVFHTMLDIASIKTEYLDSTLSVCSEKLEIKPRVYLNDHDRAIPINKLNLTRYDYEQIYKRGLYFKR